MGLFSSIGKIFKKAAPVVGSFLGGPVGGALGGIAGSYLDYRAAKRGAPAPRLNLAQLVKDAQANGFNPMTVLGMTGGNGFMQTTAPALSSKEFLASSLINGSKGYFDTKDRIADREFDNLKRDLMREELLERRERREAYKRNFGFDIPSVVTTTAVTTGALPELEAGRETATNANHRDSGKYVDPRAPDAEMAEARYGDIAQEIGGAINVGRDWWYSSKVSKIARKYGQSVADRIHSRYGRELGKTFDEIVREEIPGSSLVRPPRRPKGTRHKAPSTLNRHPALTRSGSYGRDFIGDL